MQLLYALNNVANVSKQYRGLQAQLTRTDLDWDFLVCLNAATSTNPWKL